jgi:stage IV sporulation protein FB
MLAAPHPAPYDLRFRLFDVPVRINVWFWIVMAMMCGRERDLTVIAVFIASAFVSIVVHEFGHALTARATGREPVEIVLYGMGGLCYYESGGQRPLARFLVIAAGPSAGFALLAVVLIVGKLAWGIEPLDALALVGFGPGDVLSALTHLPSKLASATFQTLIYINLVWSFLNLLPIWPLDGGQLTEVILGQVNPRQAARWTHVISLVTAGGLAVYVGSQPDPNWYRILLLGYFAFSNYQRLQEIHQYSRYGDNDQSWRGR